MVEQPRPEDATLDLGPISPELVLVDPELARLAREQLSIPPAARTPTLVQSRPQPAAEPPDAGPSRRARRLPRVGPTALVGLVLILIPTLLAILRTLHPPVRPHLESRVTFVADAATAPRSEASTRPQAAAQKYLIDDLAPGSGQGLRWAVGAFGRPTTSLRRGEYCDLGWEPIDLTIILTATGRRDPCAGEVAGGVVSGKQWRTARGLRVGDSPDRLRSLYPEAQARPDGWWRLRVVRRPVLGQLGPQPLLSAHVRGGRVDRFVLG